MLGGNNFSVFRVINGCQLLDFETQVSVVPLIVIITEKRAHENGEKIVILLNSCCSSLSATSRSGNEVK